jgi:hypothetical protein
MKDSDVELDDLLNALDRTAANLGRLEDIWSRAAPFIPSGPSRGSPPEYDNLRRAWDDLLPGLPEIEGWTITDPLPDIDSLGQAFIDYLEISEVPFPVLEAGEKPGKDLEEYKYRLSKARRRAVTKRLNELTAVVDGLIHHILFGAPSRSTKRIGGEEVDAVKAAVKEIERLIGDSVVRQGRWEDLSRQKGPPSPRRNRSLSHTSISGKPQLETSRAKRQLPCPGNAWTTKASNACSMTCFSASPSTRTFSG